MMTGMTAGMTANAGAGVVGFGTWRVMARPGGPGRLDPNDEAGALIFDTARRGLHEDALSVFFKRDFPALDWLGDYMADLTPLDLGVEESGPSFKVEEAEEEEHYDKKSVTTTEADSGWDL